MRGDSSVNQESFNSKHPEAAQVDVKAQENLHTKAQCQHQQLQHVLLQNNIKDVETGIILQIF
jgi:hypothetical protein